MRKTFFSVMDTGKKRWLAVLCGSLVLVLTVMTGFVNPTLAKPKPEGNVGAAQYQNNPNQVPPAVSIEKAKEIALKKSGGVVVLYETRYPRQGGMHYHIETVNNDMRHICHIDSSTGKILQYREEQIYINNNYTGIAAGISMEKAAETAIANAGGGIVTDCRLEFREHEQELLYCVKVMNNNKESHVHLRASDGTMIMLEQKTHF